MHECSYHITYWRHWIISKTTLSITDMPSVKGVGLTSHIPGSIMQRRTIVPVLIDHLPHVNSISNSLTNSGDVSFPTSSEQIHFTECRHSDGAVGVPRPRPRGRAELAPTVSKCSAASLLRHEMRLNEERWCSSASHLINISCSSNLCCLLSSRRMEVYLCSAVIVENMEELVSDSMLHIQACVENVTIKD